MWWLLIPAAVLIFLAVLIIRALLFKPKKEAPVTPIDAPIDADRAFDHLAQMVRCRTESFYDKSRIDESQFDKFRSLLDTLYPRFTAAAEKHRIETGILYHLKGREEGRPAVFMAHFDVVPVNEAQWERPAFDGLVEDGVLWGRGTLDTKGTLCATLESIETLLAEGFTPEHDMYFAFAGDEEVNGVTAPAIVSWFEEHGVEPEMVIDEGGAVVENVFPGVKERCALVGIAEKGMMNASFELKGAGGHASAPPIHTAIGRLSKAVLDVENHPFKRQLAEPIAKMFDTLGRHSSFTYRLIFSNLWCFFPVLDMICKKSGGELNAMVRTTCAFTQASGSQAINVLPPDASVSANLRLLGTDTAEKAQAYLRSIVKDPDIQITNTYSMDPSRISVTEGPGWERLRNAILGTWTDAIYSPYLMLACSDSRHYGRISDRVYRFSAMALSKEDRGMIHGNNERIRKETLTEAVAFYYRLMKQFG